MTAPVGNGGPLPAEDQIATLVAACKRREPPAMAELYRRFFPAIYGYARFALRSPEKAEDVTGSVFLRVLERIDSYEARKGEFKAWVFQIARNAIIDEQRRESRVVADPNRIQRHQAALTHEDHLSALMPWITGTDLSVLVERLPDRQREVLILRYLLDFNTEQIATVLGASTKAVHHLHGRALGSLKERLTASNQRRIVRSRRTPIRMRPKPLPVLGARRFVLENSLRPAALLLASRRLG